MFEEAITDAQTGTTRRIAEFSTGLDWHALPEPVRRRATAHLVDTLGAIIAGMSGEVAGHVAALIGPGTGQDLKLPGGAGRASGGAFALICGTAGHGIELDDGYREGSVHPGVSVVPALLAAAGRTPVDGPRFLSALVAGYEVICAIAEAGHPALRNRGYHPTSATGPLGAATAVAHLMAYDAARTETALGLAASACSGLFAFLSGGADVKRLHGGYGARGGFEAALLAGAGVSAPRSVIEGPSGWAQAFTGIAIDPPFPPDRGFRILDCYMKPHACCRHLQPAFEAARDLIGAEGLSPDEIESIEVETYAISSHHASVGWDSFANAQLSFPYVMALAVEHGDAALGRFDAAHRAAPALARAAGKLQVRTAPDLDARYPAERPARVTLRTTRGVFKAARDEASGGPEEPLDDAAIRAKFLGLAAPTLGAGAAEALFDAAWTLDRSTDVAATLGLTG